MHKSVSITRLRILVSSNIYIVSSPGGLVQWQLPLKLSAGRSGAGTPAGDPGDLDAPQTRYLL